MNTECEYFWIADLVLHALHILIIYINYIIVNVLISKLLPLLYFTLNYKIFFSLMMA